MHNKYDRDFNEHMNYGKNCCSYLFTSSSSFLKCRPERMNENIWKKKVEKKNVIEVLAKRDRKKHNKKRKKNNIIIETIKIEGISENIVYVCANACGEICVLCFGIDLNVIYP